MEIPKPGIYFDGVESDNHEYRTIIIFTGLIDKEGWLKFASIPLPIDDSEYIKDGLYYSGCRPDSDRVINAVLIEEFSNTPALSTIQAVQKEFPELFI